MRLRKEKKKKPILTQITVPKVGAWDRQSPAVTSGTGSNYGLGIGTVPYTDTVVRYGAYTGLSVSYPYRMGDADPPIRYGTVRIRYGTVVRPNH